MGNSSGITGIVRVGSAWRAHFTSPDTGQRVFSPTFADKWAAAQWREAANFDQSPLDLSAALRAVGALDHADTTTRYLGSLRVSEAAQPERERLRQQVAKFSA